MAPILVGGTLGLWAGGGGGVCCTSAVGWGVWGETAPLYSLVVVAARGSAGGSPWSTVLAAAPSPRILIGTVWPLPRHALVWPVLECLC